MAKKIVFVGKGNQVNSALFQVLNQTFDMNSCTGNEKEIIESIKLVRPDALLISLVGDECNYSSFFDVMKSKYAYIPVITIGTESECREYAEYFKEKQFCCMLRPVSSQQVVNMCQKIFVEETAANQNKVVKETSKMPHILIVDDNAMVLRNVKALIEDKYSIAVATSGSQALVSISKKKPDLILLDYEMPVMDGQATLEMLQSEEDLKDIPVIFLTSASSEEVVKKLIALKPAGYILKPADRDVLLERIGKALVK